MLPSDLPIRAPIATQLKPEPNLAAKLRTIWFAGGLVSEFIVAKKLPGVTPELFLSVMRGQTVPSVELTHDIVKLLRSRLPYAARRRRKRTVSKVKQVPAVPLPEIEERSMVPSTAAYAIEFGV